MTIQLLGIKNCDTVRKARKWLKQEGFEVDFIDLRDAPLTKSKWEKIVANTDPSTLVNTRGTTWRKLDDSEKDVSSSAKVVTLLTKNPTVMKRPLLISGKTYHIGFKPDQYAEILK